MKNLLLLSTLTLSLMFSAGSWAEWTEVSEGVSGNKVYVDFDKIHKIGGVLTTGLLPTSPSHSPSFCLSRCMPRLTVRHSGSCR